MFRLLDHMQQSIRGEGRDPEHQITRHLNPRKHHLLTKHKNHVSLPLEWALTDSWDCYLTETRNLRPRPLVYGSAGDMSMMYCRVSVNPSESVSVSR